MERLFSAYVLAMLLGIVFIPLFVIALVMMRSASRAFVLAATFTGGRNDRVSSSACCSAAG